jgi:hypothetical protein
MPGAGLAEEEKEEADVAVAVAVDFVDVGEEVELMVVVLEEVLLPVIAVAAEDESIIFI